MNLGQNIPPEKSLEHSLNILDFFYVVKIHESYYSKPSLFRCGSLSPLSRFAEIFLQIYLKLCMSLSMHCVLTYIFHDGPLRLVYTSD